MLKLVRLYDISYKNENVMEAHAEELDIISDYFSEDEVLDLYLKHLDSGKQGIFVIWDVDFSDEYEPFASCEYTIFGDSIDVAEWCYKEMSEIAAEYLGYRFKM